MPKNAIDKLIINSPYSEPSQHWKYDREKREFFKVATRRPAGYLVASKNSQSFDDPGIFIEIPLVNLIRQRVKIWRDNGYAGVSGTTLRLLDYWIKRDPVDSRQFFFCQIEAIETLIWIVEAPPDQHVGVDIPSDGGSFLRLCSKMATGSGKTIVMAMLIAWHVLNKVANPQDPRFSKDILVIAPGLTVKNRLSVLDPNSPNNYYDEFGIIPPTLYEKLRHGRVLIRNWHALNWETDEQIASKKGVDKRGTKSDEAYCREVMGRLHNSRNILVINDEAHHAWRRPSGFETGRVRKSEINQATKWIGGLDRIHRTRGIKACYDFSATPFIPSGSQSSAETLFQWIVSDFGLNDAIESGLVKTPRVVVRDDAVPNSADYKSRLYHIYEDPEVKSNLGRKAGADAPLPDLVLGAYLLLGFDWLETKREWEKQDAPTPPVIITVANRTETAARIKSAFEHNKILVPELCNQRRMLHIDSKALEAAESAIEQIDTDLPGQDLEGEQANASNVNKQTKQEILRRMVDTVGKPDSEGSQIQNVISVAMLSEGWDAQTVTHIMGLRAFSSQLLCEQVVGRGLRRTSYEVGPDGLFAPEYVNIFGVPFSFLPHEDEGHGPPNPPKPTTLVSVDDCKGEYELHWPNVLQLSYSYSTKLTLDWDSIETLELDSAETAQLAELAPLVDGKLDESRFTTIDLHRLAHEFRLQRIAFEVAADVYHQMTPDWKGGEATLLAQLVQLIEQFVASRFLEIRPKSFQSQALRRRLMLALNMSKIVEHIWHAVKSQNAETVEPVFDFDRPVGSTSEMRTWYTTKPCIATRKSHINFCTYDSTWEESSAFALDQSPLVRAWAKNDHLFFEIYYIYQGVVGKYYPDFLIRLRNGTMLVLEVKGRSRRSDDTKLAYLREWVRAVNSHAGFGYWVCDVARHPNDIQDILEKYATTS